MNLSEYNQYNSQFAGGKEVIDAALWDTLLYTSAATTVLTFFNATRATVDLSNMRAAGQLPAPESFLVRAIRCYIKNVPESTNVTAAPAVEVGMINDIARLINTATLQLNIGQKDYGIYPLHLLPAGGGAHGVVSVHNILIGGAGVDWAQTGTPHVKNTFTLAKPVLIKSQINFNVTVTWAAALTLVRNQLIQIVLDGDLIRAIQ